MILVLMLFQFDLIAWPLPHATRLPVIVTKHRLTQRRPLPMLGFTWNITPIPFPLFHGATVSEPKALDLP